MPVSIINKNTKPSEEEIEEKGEVARYMESDSDKGSVVQNRDVIRIETTKTKIFRKLPVVLGFLLVLLLFVFVYRLAFRSNTFLNPVDTGEKRVQKETPVGNSQQAKDYENPLNGAYFSNEQASRFKDAKPIAVMVNNYYEARPTVGLSYADVVYEAVAEGGITRLMPIFHSRIPEKVGSVRSARYYFVELASGYSAHYFHWGAAHVPPCQEANPKSKSYCPPVNGKVETNPDVDAYKRIVELGVPNLDGGNYAKAGGAFYRDPERLKKLPLEHTAFVNIPLALDLARKIRPEENWHKYIPVQKWEFKDDAPMDERGSVGSDKPITYNYWDLPAFEVQWLYDKNSNSYLRKQGGVIQKDGLNGEELRAKTVIIRYTKQEPVGDRKHHLYTELVGTGKALIIQDGKVIEGKWNRKTHSQRDVYTDAEGEPIKLVRGQIWVQILPEGNKVQNITETKVAEPAKVD